jgi:hypothetical protein
MFCGWVPKRYWILPAALVELKAILTTGTNDGNDIDLDFMI